MSKDSLLRASETADKGREEINNERKEKVEARRGKRKKIVDK